MFKRFRCIMQGNWKGFWKEDIVMHCCVRMGFTRALPSTPILQTISLVMPKSFHVPSADIS